MRSHAIAGVALMALWACANSEMPDQQEGEGVYANNCAACHGATGLGDGALASEMTVKPADLTKISQQNAGEFPVSAMLSKIDGYSVNSKAQVAMPGFGALLEGDLVPVETEDGVMTPTPRKLAALLSYLESIQKLE